MSPLCIYNLTGYKWWPHRRVLTNNSAAVYTAVLVTDNAGCPLVTSPERTDPAPEALSPESCAALWTLQPILIIEMWRIDYPFFYVHQGGRSVLVKCVSTYVL